MLVRCAASSERAPRPLSSSPPSSPFVVAFMSTPASSRSSSCCSPLARRRSRQETQKGSTAAISPPPQPLRRDQRDISEEASKAVVNLGRGEDNAAPLAEGDNVLHLHLVVGEGVRGGAAVPVTSSSACVEATAVERRQRVPSGRACITPHQWHYEILGFLSISQRYHQIRSFL